MATQQREPQAEDFVGQMSAPEYDNYLAWCRHRRLDSDDLSNLAAFIRAGRPDPDDANW